MREQAVLTLDVGLTNCKASVFGVDGVLLAQQARRYPTSTPQPDRSEQDPAHWWEALAAATRELLAMPGVGSRDILAVSVTAHMHGLIALDERLQPLTRCWTLFDRRAEAEAREVRRRLGPGEAYRRTGGRLEGYTPAAKIAWLQEHESDLLARTSLFLAPKDMLRVMLGGEPVTDPVDAAGTLLWNLPTREWDESLTAAVGARPDQLPEVREPWAEAGRLSPEAAGALRLPPGLPLVVGSGDDIEVLGAGVVAPGQALEHIGTTGTVLVCTDRPVFDPAERLEVYPHPIQGRYLLGGATNAAGRSLEWAARLLGTGDPELPLVYLPPQEAPEPPIYLPLIKGERGLLWRAGATGAFVGLREEHGPCELAHAVYEGVALSLKEILEAAATLGVLADVLTAGTPLDHRAWAALRADCYGVPLQGLICADPTALGAALPALVNQRVFESLEEASAACCAPGETVTPDPARSEAYCRRFAAYRAAVAALLPTFPGAADD
jgi:xylulokinase